MILNKSLILSISVLALACEVRTVCVLEKSTLEVHKDVIFAVETDGQLNLLRQERVNVGQRLHMICNETYRIAAICNQRSVFNRSLTLTKCDKPTKSIVDPIQDNACEQQMYRVGYKIKNDFLEIYRSCYDPTKARAYYTMHDAYNYKIVTERPTSWTMDNIITSAMAATFRASNVHQRFRLLLGNQQNYSAAENHTLIHRGHLTPSGDFLFINNMKSTFKYINAAPQFGSINYGNWLIIEKWVRTQLDPSLPSRVVTGAIGVLQVPISTRSLRKVPLYLANNYNNPIPKWMFKIISTPRGRNLPPQRTVFLTYNNIVFDEDPFETNLCVEVMCPRDCALNTKDVTYGKTYCCDPTHFTAKHLSRVII